MQYKERSIPVSVFFRKSFFTSSFKKKKERTPRESISSGSTHMKIVTTTMLSPRTFVLLGAAAVSAIIDLCACGGRNSHVNKKNDWYET